MGEGLAARTAASFCVFLTLETATFFCAGAALWTLDLGDAFLVFSATFCVLAALFTGRDIGRDFVSLRIGALAALARLALGRAVFAFIARFAVLAEARLPDGRVVDRRKAFVRLLLMGGISKGYPTE